MMYSLLVVLLIALAGRFAMAEDADYTDSPTAKLVVYKVSYVFFNLLKTKFEFTDIYFNHDSTQIRTLLWKALISLLLIS